MTKTRATELRSFATPNSSWSVLADGSHVLHVSVQMQWVYVKVIRPDGRFITRRYRHDHLVQTQEASA